MIGFPFASALGFFADLYFLSLEILFWFTPTGEGMITVAALVLGIAAFASLGRRHLERLPGAVGRHAARVIWTGLAVPVLVVQVYVLALAWQAERIQLVGLVAVGIAACVIFGRLVSPEADEERPVIEAAPAATVLLLVALYLFVGMVMGHLATPLVHGQAERMAALSRAEGLVYRLAVQVLLWLPVMLWFHRQGEIIGKLRWFAALPAVSLVLLFVPTEVCVRATSVLVAVAAGAFLCAAGFSPIRIPHPDPRRLAAQAMLLSLLGMNAVTVHYALDMWTCRDLPAGVRSVSDRAGAFDLATTHPGGELLVSLREPQQLLFVDPAAAAVTGLIDTQGRIEDTGSMFSWVEPETLLPLSGDRVLLLLAVSDDEEANRVAVIGPDRSIERLLDDLPRTSIADMVSDGRGRAYLSTEFDDKVLVLDEASLEVVQEIEWPDAETNKILVAADEGRMFSVGLWSDPELRVLDLATGEETDSLNVGTRIWDMAYDAMTRRLYVPRLVPGTVLVIDTDVMEVVDRWRVGFGARPVEIDPFHRLLYLGNMYSGRVHVFDLDTGDSVAVVRLGGYIKGLTVDPRTHRAYVGCMCGIFELDPTSL